MKTSIARFVSALVLTVSLARAADPDARVIADVAFLEPGRSEKLDIYLPPPSPRETLSPAMVWIHGGGFTGGDKAQAREKNIANNLAAAGYVIASINYKLGGGSWPQNIRDCKNAVRFLRAHAAEYHVDPERIVVGGGSAGAYLALMVGFTAGNPKYEPDAPYPHVSSQVRAIVDFYGSADFLTRQQTTPDGVPTGKPRERIVDSIAVFGAATREDEVFRTASAVGYVTKNSPPVLIAQGKMDPEVDYLQAGELAAVLDKNGVAHELHFLEGVGHSFDLDTWKKKPLPVDLKAVVLTFLKTHNGAAAK